MDDVKKIEEEAEADVKKAEEAERKASKPTGDEETDKANAEKA